MPNWCYNSITVSHKDPAMLERFKKASENGILQEFIPCPQELLETTSSPGTKDIELQRKQQSNLEKYGAADWYNWNVENWGTKWDVTCEDVDIRGDTISTSFNSAWSPPIQAYNKLQELGFVIDAYYNEPGMSFAGRYVDGDEEYIQYDFSNENWRETMSDELADSLECEYESWLMWQDEEEKEQA